MNLTDKVCWTNSLWETFSKGGLTGGPTDRDRRTLVSITVDHINGLKQHRPSAEIAHTTHVMVDEQIQKERARDPNAANITCQKGCSFCCRVAVTISRTEATLLARIVREEKIEVDVERLRRQSAHGLKDWNTQAPADRACVFLDGDGCCRVYKWRPNACRKYFVISRPALCDTVAYPGGGVTRWMSPVAECIESANLTVFGSALLPHQLLRTLKVKR